MKPQTDTKAPPVADFEDELSWVRLGALTKAHGLQGEIRLFLHNHASATLQVGSEIWLRRGRDLREKFAIRCMREHKGLRLVHLVGVETREAAEALRGAEVYVPQSSLPAPAEDEFYVRDLVGCEVVDESGAAIASVVEVYAYPSCDCLAIETPEGERIDVPFLEAFCPTVDLTARRVAVRQLESLPRQAPRRARRAPVQGSEER